MGYTVSFHRRQNISTENLAYSLQGSVRMELANNRGPRAEKRQALVSDLKIAVWVNLGLSLMTVAMIVFVLRHSR